MKRLAMKGLAAALAAAATAAAAWAAPAVGEGELLFMSNRRGDVFEYYRMAPDGSRVLRLLAEDGEVGDLSVSTDGRRVLYTRAPRGGHHTVFVTTLADGATRQLTADALPATQPTWSPDGQSIAFVSMQDGRRKIHVMDADGAHRRRLSRTPDEVDEIAPSFSPDGARLAFLASSLDTAPRVMVAALADGHARAVNADTQRRFETPPQWSADGSRLLFSVIAGSSAHAVSAAADGSGATVLTRGENRHSEPRWSADGQRLLMLVTPPNEARARLAVAQADGSGLRTLLGGEHDLLGAQWSCDGRRILLVEQQPAGGRILSVTAEGRDPDALSAGEGFDTALQVHCGPATQRLAALR